MFYRFAFLKQKNIVQACNFTRAELSQVFFREFYPISEAAVHSLYIKSCSKKSHKIYRKKIIPEYLLNKVASLQPAILSKNETPAQVFSCEFPKIPDAVVHWHFIHNKNTVLKKFTKVTRKHLWPSLALEPVTLSKKRLQHLCFPLKLQNFSRQLFWKKHLPMTATAVYQKIYSVEDTWTITSAFTWTHQNTDIFS